MFTQMRRRRQELSPEENIEILQQGTTGVLAVYGMDGYPYTIPINYLYANSKIYFHGAKTGHKIDAIENNNKVSFCVIDKDELVPEKYTTYFRSVVVFGKMRILKDKKEMFEVIETLAKKFVPDDTKESRDAAIDKEFKFLSILELTPDYISGKEAIELVKIKTLNRQKSSFRNNDNEGIDV